MSQYYRTQPITPGRIVEVPVPSPCTARLVERVEREMEKESERHAAQVREAMKGIAARGIVEYGYAIEM